MTYETSSGDHSLTVGHYDEIIKAYDLASASDSDKAKMLLCLAALFTNYSSTAIFGTEYESPEMLRFYAYALMEKAHKLDKRVFEDGKENAFADWRNRLLGLANAHSCSGVLSILMNGHIRKHFPAVMAAIMPPAWS
ncbi:hypothetical protein ABK905_06390 [Acerihabitans sp. KWT182]|uniref:E3 ubiquitin-protein ligase SopA-like catalytic domain-containing protein n=1 Tax=Acerihabitans sp. KWT182 TaxID=3157919 RepID=A0AAU7QI54_9GAMM